MNKAEAFIKAIKKEFPDAFTSNIDFYAVVWKLTDIQYDGVIKLARNYWLAANEEAICPLCYYRLDNGEAHGSWCK